MCTEQKQELESARVEIIECEIDLDGWVKGSGSLDARV